MAINRRSFVIAGAGLLGRIALPAGAVALVGCSGTPRPAGTPGFEGATMGTGYSVRLGTPAEPEALAQLEIAVRAVLTGVESRMSTYDEQAELARFNRSRDTDWQPLSPDTLAVLDYAVRTSRDSGGVFDASVGPLVNLWGFGPEGTVEHAPAQGEVDRMLERVGWQQIEVDTAAGAARKRRADAGLDFSGIAKGFGVDAVAGALSARGVRDFLVEVGGEVATRGTRPGGEPWRVAVEQPLPGNRRLHRMLDLRGRAIASSGDYRNFFTDGEQRYSHSIDPRSGRPVEHKLASVSVVADSAMQADAASTALMVLGPEAGPQWAEEQGVAALFLVREGGRLREIASAGLDPHLLG